MSNFALSAPAKALRVCSVMAAMAAGASALASAFGPTQELPAGGLVFVAADRVQVVSEDVTIALDRVEIGYVIRAVDRERVSLAFAFPLPVIDLAQLQSTEVAIPAFDPGNPTNFVGFWTLVDDKPVEPEVDIRALAVGHIDVTRRLLEAGLPIYPLAPDMREKLATLRADARDELVDASILAAKDGATLPLWALHTVFHWRTTIGATPVTVKHHYKPTTGSARWSAEFAETAKRKYCMSDADAAELDRRAAVRSAPVVYWVHYHPASNSWVKGPTEAFQLTIDKGRAAGIAATCVRGLVQKTDTTLELVAADRTDDQDIDVLFVE